MRINQLGEDCALLKQDTDDENYSQHNHVLGLERISIKPYQPGQSVV